MNQVLARVAAMAVDAVDTELVEAEVLKLDDKALSVLKVVPRSPYCMAYNLPRGPWPAVVGYSTAESDG